MKKLNNKGFTLIEVLAVIAIIAILGLIAVPGVLNSINNSKKSSYNIMISNIKTASQSLYEEVDYMKVEVYNYKDYGPEPTPLKITDSSITVNLQTLVSNGYLKGTTSEKEGEKKLILTNPIDGQNIGSCKITITKETNQAGKVNYKIESKSTTNSSCPKTNEYN